MTVNRVAIVAAIVLTCARSAAADCTISTTNVNFGSYNVFAVPPVDSTGSVTYRCTNHPNVTIVLSKGSSTTFSPRTLKNGSNALNYNLYLDAARITVWGDGTSSTSVYSSASVSNGNIVVTVYGRIPAAQDVSAGAYSDSLTATINF